MDRRHLRPRSDRPLRAGPGTRERADRRPGARGRRPCGGAPDCRVRPPPRGPARGMGSHHRPDLREPDGFPEEVSYGAAKAAQVNFTLSAATELARFGVTANVVHPPITDTGWVNQRTAASAQSAAIASPRPTGGRGDRLPGVRRRGRSSPGTSSASADPSGSRAALDPATAPVAGRSHGPARPSLVQVRHFLYEIV